MPINESTGSFIYNLPLYTYKAGNLSLPISLNYFGRGVKVDQLSTWTGVNWTLNAGGVITRTVYHRPDELVSQRIFEEDIGDLNLSNPYDSATTLKLYFTSNSDTWDTQPDIFNFSFLNYSGSFFLDKDYKPKLIKGDLDLEIEIEGPQSTNKTKLAQNKHFIITTPDGIKYYFGLNETQDTQRRIIGAAHQVVSPLATTAFYLYKIKHPLNGEILLEYTKTSNYEIRESQDITSIKYFDYYPDTIDYYDFTCQCIVTIPNPDRPILNEEIKNNRISNFIEQGVFLSRIHSTDSSIEVLFNIDNNGKHGIKHFKDILGNIEVNNDQILLSKIDLKYIYNTYSGITQRFFLEKVIFDEDRSTRKFQEYNFTYKNLSLLPSRFSYSQDHLGYFNNETNTSLLKSPDDGSAYLGADIDTKRDSDFEIRSTGTLTKITYPTKGFTQIEYEAPLKKKIVKKSVSLETHINRFENYIYDKATATYVIGGNFVEEGENPIEDNGAFLTEIVDVNVSIYTEIPLVLHHSELINFDKIDVTDENHPIIQHQRIVIGSPDSYIGFDGEYYAYIFNATSFEFIKNHKYIIRLRLEPEGGATIKLGAKLKFTYTKGYELKIGEGVRVKRISDYKNNTDLTPKNIKRFYYTKIKNSQKEPLEYVDTYTKPVYDLNRGLPVLHCCDPMNILLCYLFMGSGGKLFDKPVNYNEQIINNYEDVTISYGGDNFENGGVEKKFKKDIFQPIMNIHEGGIHVPQKASNFLSTNIVSTSHGQLLRENFIKKQNGVLYKVQEKSYSKSYVNLTHIFGHLFDHLTGCGCQYKDVILDKYNIFERKINSSTTTTKTYIDPYPMVEDASGNLPDENLYRKIVSTQTVHYDSALKGLPTKIETTGNLPGETIIIENKYVSIGEVNSLENLTNWERMKYNDLRNMHRIEQPIETKKILKKAGDPDVFKLLETKRTIYDLSSNGDVLPKRIQTSKGENSLEDRMIFSDYDGNGNLTEVSYKDGAKIRYRYNGRGQVIEKIENYMHHGSTVPIDMEDIPSNCNRNTTYPNSLVTTYKYDNTTHLLESITNPHCERTFYEYDAFHHLQYIKDNEGNILQEYDSNYRR